MPSPAATRFAIRAIVMSPIARHYPGLYVVGDYLFDSTLNGVLDSADFVTDLILTELRKRKYAAPAVNGHAVSAARKPGFRRGRRGLPRPVRRHEHATRSHSRSISASGTRST